MPPATRILADRSKDSGSGGIFANLLPSVTERPGERFQCTDNRRPLTAKLLSGYDVLTVCGQSLKPYTQAELKAIRGFVEEGGGLLLAANAAAFEFEANAAVETMAQNAVAELFGARFLSADCKGAKAHGSLQVHMPCQRVRTHHHPATGPHAASMVAQMQATGPISVPSGASVLASYMHTGQPVAAAFRHGKGRVVIVGTTVFAELRGFLCAALAHWLAGGSHARASSERIPSFLGGRGRVERGDYFHVPTEENCADRMQEVLELLHKADAACKDFFGKVWKPRRSISIVDTLTPLSLWWWTTQVGGQAPTPSLARQAIRALLAGLSREMHEFFSSLFGYRSWEIEFTVRLLRAMGQQAEADRCRERADRWIREMDGRAAAFDLARNYVAGREECPRGLQVARELLDSHGPDLVRKTAEALPPKDPFKDLPPSYAWTSDRAIYFLSVATVQDLFPWFAKRGFTVHRLPVVKPTAKNVRTRMLRRLNEALRDEHEALSSRLEAASDLALMGRAKDWKRDDWGRLCRALRWGKQGDTRAAGELRKLFATSKPKALRAAAGVALADLGERSVEHDLVALARGFDPRFQLAAGYALEKAGSARARELSLPKVGELSVVFDGDVRIHGLVEGYKVNNIYSSPMLRSFGRGVAVSSYFVMWVHTSPQWRRRGLSRYAMEATMGHPSARQCSCSSLGTGTRNVAHRLYHDFGFTDTLVWREWTCPLASSAPPRLPTGIVFREYKPGDAPRVAAFLQDALRQTQNVDELVFGELPAPGLAFLAERDGKLVGFVSAAYEGGDEAQMRLPPVAKDSEQAAIADGLLALLHQSARDAGAKTVKWFGAGEVDEVTSALHRAGYASRLTGGVWMMHIRHLVQFLNEIAPGIERRLAESEFKTWQGALDLLASRIQARLTIRQAEVSASRPTRAPADVVLRCDDETASRIVLGRETPFEAFLQSRLNIAPRVTESLTRLLETVFPKLPVL